MKKSLFKKDRES